MSEQNSVRQRLIKIFEDDLGLEAPSADADLFNSGILDSLAFVDMLLRIESAFDIALSLDTIDFDNFQTVDGIVGFIESQNLKQTPVEGRLGRRYTN